MKTPVLKSAMILACLLNAILTNGQWTAQTSGTTSYLNSVYFTDTNTGYAVGYSGIILKTSNGGTNWIAQTSGTTSPLYSVYFINEDTGYVVGYYGTILKTINGGTNWIQSSGIYTYLESVYFTDANTGYAVGLSGSILKTINGGTDWSTQTLSDLSDVSSVRFHSISFVDSLNGFMVGSGRSSNNYVVPLKFKTENGGLTWTRILHNSYNNDDFRSVFFLDSSVGYICGTTYDFNSSNWEGGIIQKTLDGGLTWTTLFDYYDNDSRNLHSTFFLNKDFGFAVGSDGLILNTIDGGSSWTAIYSGSDDLFSAFFPNTNIGYIAGANGMIQKTISGGWCTGIPGQPTGEGGFCSPTSSIDYTTTGAPFATSYIWSLNPPTAGSIAGTGTTGTVTWSGTYNGSVEVKVQGVKAGCTGEYSTTTVFVNNTLGNPGSFSLSNPSNGAWASTTPLFQWASSSGANYYRLYVDGILFKDNISTTSYQVLTSEALNSGMHTWYVVARNGCITQSNETRSFLVDATPPSSFNLSSPADNFWTADLKPTLEWSASSDAHSGLAKYQLWIDGALNRDNIATTTTTTTPVNNLTNGLHTWEIRAVDNVGSVRNSNQIWTVRIDDKPPISPNASNFVLNLDGINDYCNIPHNPSLNFTGSITIEAWIRIVSYKSWAAIVSKGGFNWSEYGYAFTQDNSGRIRFYGNGAAYTSNSTIPLNTWTHVAVTYGNSTLRFYINGMLDRSLNQNISIVNNTTSLKIGVDPPEIAEYWKGSIDEVRIWNVIRTNQELLSNKDIVLSGCESGLMGYWKFNEGIGTTVLDASINKNDGTIVNGGVFTNSLPAFGGLSNLILPSNNQYTPTIYPVHKWNSARDEGIGLEKYQLWVDCSLVQDGIHDTTWTVTSPLTYGRHTWVIKGFDSLGNSQSSTTYTFYIDNAPPNPFNLSSPADSGIVMFPTPNLSWEAATDSTGGSGMRKYQLWINGVVNRDSIPMGTTTVSPANVLPQGEYTWFVKAYDNVGNVRQSTETRTFYVDWEPPTYFSLIEPANSATVTIADPVFRWYPSFDIGSGLDKYELNISGQTPIEIAPTDTFFIPSPGLPNGTYSWFVKAFDRAGAFTSSNTHTLTIDVPLPTTPGTPSGPIELCENAANTDYTTSGAAYATSYIWELSPANAGTISGTGLTSSVNWNDSFTGNVQITVKGLNPLGEGPVSAPLLIEIFPAAVPGVVTGDSSICLGQSTGTLTLSNYTGSILKWQKSYNGGNWVDIAAYTDSYSEIPVSSGLWTYRAMVKRGICPALPSLVLNVEVGDVPSAAGIISGQSTVCEGQQNVVYSVPLIPGAISYQWSLPNGVTGSSTSNTISANYTSAVSGAISVRGINACGAGTASQLSISVQALPPVAILGKSDICMGESTLLQAQISQAGTYSYLWSPSGATTSSITVQGNAVGSIDYAVTVTDQYGCSSYGSVNVNTHPNPSLQITGDSVVCLGGIIDLTASASPAGTYTYLWSYQNVNTAKLTIPNLPAGNYQYTVTATDVFGCTATELINALVRTQPIPDVTIQGPVNLCLGDEAILTSVVVPAGNYAYQWLPGNQVTQQLSIQGDVVGVMNYTLRVVDSYGCTGIGSHSVTSNANPAVSIGGRRSINPGGSTDLTALPSPAGSYSYSWNPGGATTAGISVSPSQQTSYYVTVTDNILGCSASASAVVIINDDITLRTRVLLQGAYAGSGAMSTLLNSSGLLPHNQPFGVAPWNYPGQEHITTIPSDITDWILVDLRSATDTAVYRRAGLLRNDGVVLDIDEAPGLLFSAAPGDYYLAISHPRHLSIMSMNRISIPSSTVYDFTDTLTFPVFGKCVISLSGGFEAMIAGDVNQDKILKYSGSGNDRGLILQRILNEVGGTAINAITSGYFREDLRMDGTVKYSGSGNDPSLIIQNLTTLTGSNAINSTFSGSVPHAVYIPQSCYPQPDQAHAGPDSLNIPDTSIFLQANQPVKGTGVWSIFAGTGGSFSDSSLHNTLFSGLFDSTYILVWTISTPCGSTSDTVEISFAIGEVTITVGTDSTVNSETTYPSAYGQWYTGDRVQYLLLASELNSLGIHAGSITSLAFDVITPTPATPDGSNLKDFTIRIGTTDTSSLSAWLPTTTQVYWVPGFVTVVGWNTHSFSVPFHWDGISNLVIETCFDNYITSSDYSENAVVRQSQTSYPSVIDYHDDIGGVCNFSDIPATYYLRPNMKFGFKPSAPLCTPLPDQANAGPDSLNIPDTSIILQANQPVNGTGVWSILSGTGGRFADSTVNNTLFIGQPGSYYTLEWSISTHCGMRNDIVNISFRDTSAYSCGNILLDTRDGQQYRTIQIGTQCWMRENLNVGPMVISVNTGSSHSDVSNNGVIEKYCYNNDAANCAVYGGLYDWNEAMGYNTTTGSQGICPTGWHLPTDAEWTILENFLRGSTVAGGKMKETGTAHWDSPNNGATNSSGFTALGAGYRSNHGNFYGLRDHAYFWSSSEYSSTYGISRYLNYYDANVDRYNDYKSHGFSVRCLRDSIPPCSPQPTQANAGPDSLNIPSTSITLQANEPVNGTGLWSILSGSGGSFVDSSVNNTLFTGQVGSAYTLVWTISNACGSSSDTVVIAFVVTSSYPTGYVHCNPANPTAIVDVTNPVTGRTWMDRNLGASQAATSATDANAYGDLYQWGRFADGHQCRNSATTTTLSTTNQPGHGSFIRAPYSPWDWRSPQNNNLWQGVNGVNNPCPAGYRLPTEAELNAERLSWSSNNSAGAYGSPLKLPLAGYRLYSNGSLSYVHSYGSYWSSSVSGTLSRYLYFDSSNAYMGYNGRAYGISVRCTKDY